MITIKKLISFFLAVTMLATSITAIADNEIIFYDTFDAAPTNSLPDNGVFIAEEAGIVDSGVKNKMLRLYSSDKTGIVKAEFNNFLADGDFAFSMDLILNNKIKSAEISLCGENKEETVFWITDNILKISNKSVKRNIVIGEKVTLGVEYDCIKKSAKIYADDEMCVENCRIPEIGALSGIKLNFYTDGECEVLLDNLYISKSNQRLESSNLPTEEYNPDVSQYEHTEEDVFFYRDFDELGFYDTVKSDGTTKFALMNNHAGTSNIACVESEENGNEYLHIESLATSTVIDIFANSYTNKNKKIQSSRYIAEQCDVMLTSYDQKVYLFNIEGSQMMSLIRVINGELKASDNQIAAKLPLDEWVTVTVITDSLTDTYDVYVDYEEVLSDIELTTDFQEFSRWRILAEYINKASEINLDNICIYNQSKPKKITFNDAYKSVSYVAADTEKNELLKKFNVINYKTDTIVIGNEKKNISGLTYINNGDVCLKIKEIADIYGKSFITKSDNYYVCGRQLANIVLDNGNAYAPYDELLSLVGKKSFLDDRGIILISDEEIDTQIYGYGKEYDLWDLVNLTMYERPTAEELQQSLKPHPRIIYSSTDIANAKEKLKTSERNQERLEQIKARAAEFMKASPISYDKDNLDGLLLKARASLNLIITLGQSYIFTENEEYAERIWQEAEAIAAFPEFHPAHFLDCGELSAALAIAYDWCYDYFAAKGKDLTTIENALYNNSVRIAEMAYCFKGDTAWIHWINQTSFNQNAVNAAGCLMAATAIMDKYPEECSRVVELSIKALEAFGESFYPSGAYSEGTTYYHYAMGFWTRAIGTLNSAYGSDFGLSLAPAIKKSTEYILAASSYIANNNFHDSEGGNLSGASTLLNWFAHEYNDTGLNAISNNITDYYGTMDYLSEINMFYGTDDTTETINVPADAYLDKLELVTLRSSWSDYDGTFVSMHAGDALPIHGHIDTGTFVIDMMGERFASDLGAEDYGYLDTIATELGVRDGKPYDWITRPEGHNCLVINPRYESGHNLDAFAKVTEFESGTSSSYAVADLSETYNEDVDFYQRGFYLGDNRDSVTIRDEFTLKTASSLCWFLHTAADINITGDLTAELTINNKTVKVYLVSNIEGAKFSVMEEGPLETSPQYGKNTFDSYKRLAVYVPDGKASGDAYIQVKLIPETNANADVIPENSPINEWKIN